MPSKDGTMDDNKKSTKDVVNKKQKQMLNQEENNPAKTVTQVATGAIKKIGKGVKNYDKKSLDTYRKLGGDGTARYVEEYLPEEEYDHYRDRILMRGGDHRSKETRERSNTPTGKQPKGKTVMQKELEKKYGKGKSALDMVKADHKDEIMDVKKKEKKKKDVKEGAGLYANIHAKRKRGGKMRKKGDKGAPSSQDFANAAKTAREELDLTQVAEAFGGQIIETKTFTGKSFVEFRLKQLNEAPGDNPNPILIKLLGLGASGISAVKKQLQKIPKIDPKKAQKLFDQIFKNKNKNKSKTDLFGRRRRVIDKKFAPNETNLEKITKVIKKNPVKSTVIGGGGTALVGNEILKKPDKKEIEKIKEVKPKKVDGPKVDDPKVDPKDDPKVEPEKDSNKNLKDLGVAVGTNTLIGNQVKGKEKILTNTDLNLNKNQNKKKKVVTTKDNKKKKSKFRLPGVPRLDTGVIGQRTAG